MARLAQVVQIDPQASAGEAEIAVPRAWLDARDTVEVTLPVRLRCHHCAGGGCDRCDRSGVVRLPEDVTARRFELPLPDRVCVLRLPVEDGALVMLRVMEGEPSDNVRREVKRSAGRKKWIVAALAVALAVALAYFGAR